MKAIDKIFIIILLVIFGGIVLHAPLSVGFGSLFPNYELLIKSWKEILLVAALLLGLYIIYKRKAWGQFNTPLFWLIGGFAALHLVTLVFIHNGLVETMAGLMIDLRYLLFFVLVFAALRLYPNLYGLFLKVFFAGALVVAVFALLQVTVLPRDALHYIGYNETTIMPYLTVDQNINYIRINSTLRGPNPLGAYAVIAIIMLVVLWAGKFGLRKPKGVASARQALVGKKSHEGLVKRRWLIAGATVTGVGSLVALWASYSRSAWLALVVALAVLVAAYLIQKRGKNRRINRTVWLVIGAVCLGLTTGAIYLKDTPFMSQVILHEDPDEQNDINSNDGHLSSLVNGGQKVIKQPFGMGVGSTGSASLLGDAPQIIENQYLFVAHEIGWLGLVLFVVVYWFVLRQLWRAWRRNAYWVSLGVFASGLGLAVIGLLLPVFVDDTVSIIWWGLAAVTLGSVASTPSKPNHGENKGRVVKATGQKTAKSRSKK